MNRIVQVTPGNIPIPTKGWGAVEKIIWEYKKQLEHVGYEVDILYADQVQPEPGQLVHVHMANLANLLHQRGIEYVFSLHDHHVEHFGRESQCYRENYEAIKNSRLAFVHSPHLIEYFDSMPNMVYLQHGANLADYAFRERSREFREGKRLLMMANNGLAGDPLIDRKGFIPGIEAARSLGLDLTIVCPGTNRQFFEHHLGSPDGREGLRILYDLEYEEAIEEMQRHNLFLNPSTLEAGHPNLTVTEALACGIPVVGTSCVEIPGQVAYDPAKSTLAEAISASAAKYDSLVGEIKEGRDSLSWEIVVTKMLQHYKRALGITEKSQLEWQYSSTRRCPRAKQNKTGISVSFSKGRAFLKTSFFSEGMHATYRDLRTNTIMFDCAIGKTPGVWSYTWTPHDRFVDWEVSVHFGAVPVHTERLSLAGERVIINGQVAESTLKEFCERTGALATTRDVVVDGACHDPAARDDLFYTTLNKEQVEDFFRERPKAPDTYLLKTNSAALGDTIAFLPYAQEWASANNVYPDVAVARPEMFDAGQYPNLRLVDPKGLDTSAYNRRHFFEYLFDRPLQRGYSDQFGLEYREILPVLKKSANGRPMRERYVVIGVQTTSQCKYWNYPGGWEKLCAGIRRMGLTPVAVDLHEVFGIDGHWNSLPPNAAHKVGMPFGEVMRWVEHSELFIGVSSGLAWLAYGLGKKVVMVTGTTSEGNEFATNCTTVSNRSVCNGCFNRPDLHRFDPGDWLWCPEHRDTERHFECTKTITPDNVMKAIRENI